MTPWTVPSKVIGTRSIDSGPRSTRTISVRGSLPGVAQPDRLAVRRDPAGQPACRSATRRAAGSGLRRAHEHALEGDRLAHPGLVVDPVDPDRVVVDQRRGLGDDRLGDAVDVLEPVQPAGQLGDRPQPAGHRPGRVGQPGVADGGRHVVGEGPGEVGLVGGPGVVGRCGTARAGRAASSRNTIGTKQMVRTPARR